MRDHVCLTLRSISCAVEKESHERQKPIRAYGSTVEYVVGDEVAPAQTRISWLTLQ
jgi:hypothetical protein